MSKIGILTYDAKHRKTYDTLCLLKAKGYSDVTVYAQPMHYKKKFFPLIEHRPGIDMNFPELVEQCENFSYKLIRGVVNKNSFEEDMIILICGAGIIPKEIIDNNLIINAHPGYIPRCRGLDSFKWAIWEDKPIGVTTHILGDYVDAGEIIERRLIKVYNSDTFFQLAQRVYENEICMLVEAIEKVDSIDCESCIPEDDNIYKRMPHHIEEMLLDKFEEYKKTHGVYNEL